jgi:hypothetical protein
MKRLTKNRANLVCVRETAPVERTSDPSTSPNFLLSAMGSAKFMRLSLMKAAREVIFGAAW